ncbi:MAG: hypothetical protein ACR2IE_02090 [Candidatus Sumerlaeaceae bacterium]
MPLNSSPHEEVILHRAPEPDPGTSFRMTAASIGLILIGVGVLMSGYMFYQIARVLLDPRPLVEQVNRWEFVIRGRANDIPVRPIERGEAEKLKRSAATSADSRQDSESEILTPGQDSRSPREIEVAADFAKRMGSLGARPAALLLMFVLLGIMVRIAIGFIDAGGRLVNLAAGEKEFMQRLLKEITRKP